MENKVEVKPTDEPIETWIERQTFMSTDDIIIPDKIADRVIGQDAINVILQRGRMRAHLDHDIKAQSLGLAALLLKRPDIRLDDMIAQRDTVARISRC